MLARTFQISTLFVNLTVMDNMLLAVQALDSIRFVLYRPLTGYRNIVSHEHDMDVAFQVAQRITVLHQGRLLADGAPEAIRKDPAVNEIYLGTD